MDSTSAECEIHDLIAGGLGKSIDRLTSRYFGRLNGRSLLRNTQQSG